MKTKKAVLFALLTCSVLFLAACTQKPADTSPEQVQQQAADAKNYQDAIANSSEQLCGLIKDESLQKNCKTNISEEAAISVAVTNSDLQKCGTLTIDEKKKKCQILVQEKIQKEEKTQNFQKNINDKNAQVDRIVSEGNVEQCSQLQDKNFITACQNSIYFNTGMQEKNISWCEKIQADEAKKEICKSNISK